MASTDIDINAHCHGTLRDFVDSQYVSLHWNNARHVWYLNPFQLLHIQ